MSTFAIVVLMIYVSLITANFVQALSRGKIRDMISYGASIAVVAYLCRMFL